MKRVHDADTQAKLVAQTAAMEGKMGSSVWAVSAVDGKKLGEVKLDSAPVFDGMAFANGRLYLATIDGKVACFGGP